MISELTLAPYVFSSDKNKLQINVIHSYLSKESYWAQNIPEQIVRKAINGSLCFGIYINGRQIAFARVITDEATFAYLADVFILEEHRGKGLSKAFMNFILNDERLQSLRRFMLATKDAHGLYVQFGFSALAEPQRFMELKAFENYRQ